MSATCVGAGEGRVQAQAAAGWQTGGIGVLKEEEERGMYLSTGSSSLAQDTRQGLLSTVTSPRKGSCSLGVSLWPSSRGGSPDLSSGNSGLQIWKLEKVLTPALSLADSGTPD